MDNNPNYNFQAPIQPPENMTQPEELPSNSPSNDDSNKSRFSWMWSLLFIIAIVVVALIVGGLYGVITGRATAREYNESSEKYLTNLAKKIEKNKTAKEISTTLKANQPPELGRYMLGAFSNTYRQSKEVQQKVNDAVDRVTRENQSYINLANIVEKGNLENPIIQEAITQMIAAVEVPLPVVIELKPKPTKQEREVSAKSLKDYNTAVYNLEVVKNEKFISLNQSCSKLNDSINSINEFPIPVKKESTAYVDSITKLCESVESLKDAQNKKDEARFKGTLVVVKENSESSIEKLQTLTELAKTHQNNKDELVKILNKTAKEISNL